MTRVPVFAANWKMHLGPREARSFAEQFSLAYAARDDRTVILCPPAISLAAVVESLPDRRDIAIGVQNVWTMARGAFTGETSAPMARGAGARYALVGHSERRHLFGETNAETAQKCAIAAESDLIPILCVGETLAQREDGTTTTVVVEQLRVGTSLLSRAQIERMLIAYEPVWAIGTGKTATPADASGVHAVVRTILAELIGAPTAEIPILYGGSVNQGNTEALLNADGVDGVLVGGASLDPIVWCAICNTVQSRRHRGPSE